MPEQKEGCQLIQIKSEKDLENFFKAFAPEITNANIYYKFFTDLHNARKEHFEEIKESHTFWYLTLEAVRETYMHTLCRIFELNNKIGFNLENFLRIIKFNLNFFDEANFKKRCPNMDYLGTPADKMSEYLKFVDKSNPLILSLKNWRDNIFMHKAIIPPIGKKALQPIMEKELKELVNKALSIFNECHIQYNGNAWLGSYPTQDDYKNLFNLLHIGLEKYKSDRN